MSWYIPSESGLIRMGLSIYLAVAVCHVASAQTPVGSAFTYQGRLTELGATATGAYDFSFALFDAPSGGNQVASSLVKEDVIVSSGVFTVSLDFGASVFNGSAHWLAVGVRPGPSTGGFSAFPGRQELSPTPNAIFSTHAATIPWSGISGTPAGFGDGHDNDALGALSCGVNQIPKWTGSAWTCAADASGTGGDHDHFGEEWQGATGLGGNGLALRIQNDDGGGIGGYGTTLGLVAGCIAGSVCTGALGTAYLNDPGAGTANTAGVHGVTNAELGAGVLGEHTNAGYGVRAKTTGTGTALLAQSPTQGIYITAGNIALTAVNTATPFNVAYLARHDFAGRFDGPVRVNGDLTVTGTVSKGGGTFRIDHPLDPTNKYLNHSFVESPEMMNVYSGNVILDEHGAATVQLPDWFEALNEHFRYQLTAIGAPSPNLFVSQEVSGNQFSIAGGVAHGRVSWQVTGIRHDAFARANPISVEEEKPESEKGTLLHPSTDAGADSVDSRSEQPSTDKRRNGSPR